MNSFMYKKKNECFSIKRFDNRLFSSTYIYSITIFGEFIAKINR